jgi:hypothetical protein
MRDTLKQFNFKRVFKHKGQVVIDLKKVTQVKDKMNIKQTTQR